MKIESQCCSLELAQKLKELGVKQDAHFSYFLNGGEYSGAIVDTAMYSETDEEYKKDKLISAFTSADLGEMLPWGVMVDGKMEALTFYKDSADQWNFLPRHGAWYKSFNEIEADARALMLIYLIENKLITT